MKNPETTNLKPEGKMPTEPPRLSAWFRLALTLMLVVVATVLYFVVYTGIASRVKAQAELQRTTLDGAVPTVTVIHPKLEARAEEVALPGNVQAFVATPIYARTSGYLKHWYFDIGAHVKAGQLLVEIETPEIDRQLDQARADLATAQANYDLSKTTADRYQSLLSSDSVARQDVEDRVGDLHAKKAMMDSASFNMRRLEEMQRFQKIYAPFDGVITARNTDIGALIDAGANAPGMELFDIAATSQLRVYVNVPQTYSRAATPGSMADLTLAELPGRHFYGKIARTADSIDPASRTLLTEVDVPNPAGELLPGAFVTVHFKLAAHSTAVVLPVNTLIFRSEGMRVAVVKDGKAVLAPVTIGRDFGTEVEVVAGVEKTDSVIENPSDSLTSGVAVHVAESTPNARKGAKP